MAACQHQKLNFECSKHAEMVGFHRPNPQERLTATQSTGSSSKKGETTKTFIRKTPEPSLRPDIPIPSTFPAPLVLPGDELSWDPEYETQSLQSWIGEEERNPVTKKQRTVYFIGPPSVANEVSFVNGWTKPQVDIGSDKKDALIGKPEFNDVLNYLKAFYCGLPVKPLTKRQLKFSAWDGEGAEVGSLSKEPKYVGLNISSETIRIRCRKSQDGTFSRQLNLNDLLDTAISLLPSDAYALLMLVDHDLYEDEDDDFCCGRAYGGSRVAVVSTARYHPALDIKQNVEINHAWPASHCHSYIDACCKPSKPAKKKAKLNERDTDSAKSAMAAAVSAFSSTIQDRNVLWLSRVCKTASHELGHCFGLDHCVYYACVMQGTAGLSEDARQPPYLCPVDMAKVLTATGARAEEAYAELLEFSERFANRDKMFAAYRTWLTCRLRELNGVASTV